MSILCATNTSVYDYVKTPEVDTKKVELRPNKTEAVWEKKHPSIRTVFVEGILLKATTRASKETRGVLSNLVFDRGTQPYKWVIYPQFNNKTLTKYDIWVGVARPDQDLTTPTGIGQKLTVMKEDRISLDLNNNRLIITHEVKNSPVNKRYIFDFPPTYSQNVHPWLSSVKGYGFSVELYKDVKSVLTTNANQDLLVNGVVFNANTCWGEDAAVCQMITLGEDVSKGMILIPSITEEGKFVKSVSDRADRVTGVALEDGVAGQIIKMGIQGVMEILGRFSGGGMDGLVQGRLYTINHEFWADQGVRGFNFNTPGVAGFYKGGVINNYTTGVFATVVDEKVMLYNTWNPPPPTLVKCRLKKVEVH